LVLGTIEAQLAELLYLNLFGEGEVEPGERARGEGRGASLLVDTHFAHLAIT
jgi:hypothetical protein